MVDLSRRPAYLRQDSVRQDRWLVSYADVITILLVLFIVAAAQSFARRQDPVQAISKAVSVPSPVAPPERLSPALAALRVMLRERHADLQVEPRGVVINLPQAIFFAPAKATVSRTALPLIEEIANVIRVIPNKVTLAGHSDSTPIRNARFRSNWELSTARSVRLLEVLVNKFDIPEARLSVASFGSYQPRTTNETPEGRAANRRVEIVLLADAAPLPSAGEY